MSFDSNSSPYKPLKDVPTMIKHFDPRALEANLTLLDPDNKLGRENMTMQDKLKVFARAKKNEANNSAVPASNSPGEKEDSDDQFFEGMVRLKEKKPKPPPLKRKSQQLMEVAAAGEEGDNVRDDNADGDNAIKEKRSKPAPKNVKKAKKVYDIPDLDALSSTPIKTSTFVVPSLTKSAASSSPDKQLKDLSSLANEIFAQGARLEAGEKDIEDIRRSISFVKE